MSRELPAGGSEPGTALRLGDIALALQGDWLMMATQLGITNPEVIKIQKEYGSVTEQVIEESCEFSCFHFVDLNCSFRF